MNDTTLAVVAQLDLGLRSNEVHEIIQSERRRDLLRALEDADEWTETIVEVADLADAVTAAEADVDEDSIPSDHRQRVYVALSQTHLPLLDDLDVVQYHDRVKKVTVELPVPTLVGLLNAIDRLCADPNGGEAA